MGAFHSQPNGYSCGQYAVYNSIIAMGGSADLSEIKRLAGTSRQNGTTRQGVLKALVALGYKGTPYRTRNADYGWKYARKWAVANPLILLVDENEHWLVVSGLIGDRVIVVDSGADKSGNELGTYSFSKNDLLARWVYRNGMYAIRVCR